MDKKTFNRAVELGKDLLILLLTALTVFLLARTQMAGSLNLLFPPPDDPAQQQSSDWEQTSVVWPVRMAASGWNGERLSRWGVQYDRAGCDQLLRSVASLLREALSSPGSPQPITQAQWQQALTGSVGLYLDLLGQVPFPVLSGWLAGSDQTPLSATVRHLLLTIRQEQVLLYYLDASSGQYYAALCDMVSAEHLAQELSALSDNGSRFAFELPQYTQLSPHTMLPSETPQPRVYSAYNPLLQESGGESGEPSPTARLLDALSFPDNSYSYSSPEGQAFRSGSDTLRISSAGVVTYSAPSGEPSRYLIPSQDKQPSLFEMAEACRRLAMDTAGALAGEGRLYLRTIQQSAQGYLIEFSYSLDGAHVQVGEAGYAAHFQVNHNEISQFTLQLRGYADTGSRSIVLPLPQAAAAMKALERQGGELSLAYLDYRADSVSAGWVS